MDEVGLVLIGHGSKLPHNRENLEKLADILRKRSRFKIVEASFMVRDRPKIPEAIESIAEQGVKKIVLIPTFLAHGVHTEQEIPEILGLKGEESMLKAQGVEIIYGEPLGSDERIAEIIEEKALRALGQEGSEAYITYDIGTLTTSNKMFESSISIVRQVLSDTLEKVPKTHATIIERVVHATADPEFAKLLFISEKAIEAGVDAIRAGASVITDVKMVKSGINESRLKRFGGRILTYIDDERAIKLANHELITRAAAAMHLAVNEGVDGSIIIIGNSPTAAFELANVIKQGLARPALIVATPVGFIGAAKSKETILQLPIPFIIVKGHKGGSAVAVAIINALLSIAERETKTSEA
ncbi:MAG: sirohydrochlorin nickelochelatase [archaeon]|nr:sirohydrochlorin nickelochelatase [archaeon]